MMIEVKAAAGNMDDGTSNATAGAAVVVHGSPALAWAARSPVLAGLVWGFVLTQCLVGLAVMCDDHLIPSLVVICHKFRIPDAAAGATLFAMASAGMDIFFSCVETAMGAPSIGLAYLLGAGIIAFGLIPPAVVYCTPGRVLLLEPLPLLRDSLFCMASFMTLLVVLADD